MKTAIANLVSLAVFAAAAWWAGEAAQGWGGLLAFQLIILFLCHEAWYRCISMLAILAELFYGLRGQEEKPLAVGKWTYRLASLALLVVPHVLYALIWGVEMLCPGQLTDELRLTPALFECSYAGVVALWIASLLLQGLPLSVERLFESRVLAPSEHLGVDTPPESAPAAALPATADMLPEHRAALASALQQGETLLYALRPNTEVLNRYARSASVWGHIIAALALFSFLTGLSCYTSYLLEHETRYLYLCACSGALALLLVYTARGKLRAPARWRAGLSAVSYAITSRRIFIFDGASVHTFDLTPELNLLYESTTSADFCIIHLSAPGFFSRAAKSIFGARAQVIDNTYAPNPARLSSGLFHVPSSLHPRLMQLCTASNICPGEPQSMVQG